MPVEADARAIRVGLNRLEDAVGTWLKRVNDEVAARWQFKDGFDEKFRQAAERAPQQAGKSPLAELYAFLDELADTYLVADAELRTEIQRVVGEHQAVLGMMYNYIGHTASRLKESGSDVWLKRGLAGAAIEDARIDFRDLYILLGDLYLEANRAGINPRPFFEEVAARANREPVGQSTARMLEQFEESAYFAAEVQPKV